MTIKLKAIRITDEKTFLFARDIRKSVFVKEQGVPAENEFDEHEYQSDHILVSMNDSPCATGRVRQIGKSFKLERICVLKSYRKYGIGKFVVAELEKLAKEKGIDKVILNSQTHAMAFYEKLGYKKTSDVFYEENIPHVSMEKTI